MPLIIGDAAREETLRAASVGTCQALVVVSTDDVTNLQAALNGRALRRDLRVVLRLFDGDFARRIQTAFNIEHLAQRLLPGGARLRRGAAGPATVIATIPVDRHALLVAEVVGRARLAAGRSAARGGRQADGVRVIALVKAGERPLWSPPPDLPLGPGDRSWSSPAGPAWAG